MHVSVCACIVCTALSKAPASSRPPGHNGLQLPPSPPIQAAARAELETHAPIFFLSCTDLRHCSYRGVQEQNRQRMHANKQSQKYTFWAHTHINIFKKNRILFTKRHRDHRIQCGAYSSKTRCVIYSKG